MHIDGYRHYAAILLACAVMVLAAGSAAGDERPPLASSDAPPAMLLAQAGVTPGARGDLARGTLEEIVVSARKRTETQVDVPISITAFSAESLERLNVRSFEDYATKTPNLSFAYGTGELGFGSTRSVSIRGISGEGTVGVYIDDTPVPDTIDPRVVDIERVEVLKGPQGTLFGQGSLGGNLRIITVQPSTSARNGNFEARVGGTSGGTGPDFGASFAANQNLVGEALTARLVGFIDHTAGFITRTYPRPDGSLAYVPGQGADHTYGGSLALLWHATAGLNVTLRMMFQQTENYGWPAPYAPRPAFDVVSLTMNRSTNIQEGSVDHWYLPALILNYRGAGFTVTSSTSYFDRDVLDTEDASEGTRWYFLNLYGYAFPSNLPSPWEESIPQRRTTNETRLSFDPVHGLSGTVGVYVSRQFSNEIDDGHNLPGLAASGLTSFPGYCPGSPPCPSYGSNLNWYSAYPLYRQDEDLFGEFYFDYRKLQVTVGARYYHDMEHFSSLAEGAGNGYIAHSELGTTQTGVTPKVALAYKPDPQHMVYASAAKGFREGGVTQAPISQCGLLPELGLTAGEPAKYKPDTVWNYELGGKSELADGRMILSAAVFQMDWRDIQQPISLPICFLGITVNEGAARARGGEIELTGRPMQALEVRAGLGYDNAKITAQSVAVLAPAGSRIVQVPRVTGNLSGTYTVSLSSTMKGFVTGDYSYVGDSISNTGSLGFPLTRHSYSLLNGSVGVQWGSAELSLYAANLTNRHPNLGDLNPAGYVKHVSDAPDALTVPRVATLRPFNAGLQYRQRF